MRELTPALLASAGSFWAPGRAIKLTRVDGTIVRVAEMMTARAFDGDIYLPGGNLVVGSIPLAINEEAASIDFDVLADVAGVIEPADVLDGLYRDADVEVYCINRFTPADGLGLLFSGKVGAIQARSNGRVTMQVTGPIGEAAIQLGHKFSPTCRWIFGEPGCDFPIDTVKVIGTVTAPGTGHSLPISGFTHSDPMYDPRGGFLVAQTGRIKGFRFEFARPGFSAFLYLPVGHLFEAGDVLWIYPDCTYLPDDTGCAYYDWILQFGGEPYMFGANALTGGINNLDGLGGTAGGGTTPPPPGSFEFGDSLGGADDDDFSDLGYTEKTFGSAEWEVPASDAATEADITKLSIRISVSTVPGSSSGALVRGVLYSETGELLGATDIYETDGSEPEIPPTGDGTTKLVELTFPAPVRVAVGDTIFPSITHQYATHPDLTSGTGAHFLSRVPGITRLTGGAPNFADIGDAMPDPWPADDGYPYEPDDIGKIAIRVYATRVVPA